jgi:hypothetical protein
MKYLILDGYTLLDLDGKALGHGGDVVDIPTDSTNYAEARAAHAMLVGQTDKVHAIPAEPEPERPARKRAKKAKAEAPEIDETASE